MKKFGLAVPSPIDFKKILFLIIFVFCLFPIIGSATALILGAAIALFVGVPFDSKKVKSLQSLLLQASVVGLGAGMNLIEVARQGASSIPMTFVSLAVILGLGLFFGSKLMISKSLTWLLACGTAICGGSAIAAVSPVVGAKDDETSTALGIVFVLNAIGLLLFPLLGRILGLSEMQFGMFAALAIHDTSSVVGAASQVGPVALAVATTTKLVRALWIVPLVLFIAVFRKADPSEAGRPLPFPKFIFGFIAMSAAATLVPELFPGSVIPGLIFTIISDVARRTLVASIFLIGLAINPTMIKKTGGKALLLSLGLWMASIFISYFLAV